MTQRDFLAFAQRVKSAGISFSEARKKFELAMGKVAVTTHKAAKKPIRIVKDGIRVYPDGRERCITKAAWAERRRELYVREGGFCHRCANHCDLARMDADHIRKRSLGRDDRLSNLQLLCRDCHAKKHDEFKNRNYHAGAGK